jgi:hypothetical protein
MPRKAPPTLTSLLDGPPPFSGDMMLMMDIAGLTDRSWDAWRTFWRVVFGLPLSPDDMVRYTRHTGRLTAPSSVCRRVWMPIGRGAGKSWNVGLAGLFLAISRDYRTELPPGGVAVIPVVGADRDQARLVLGYIKGLMEFERFSKYQRGDALADSISFTTGARIEIKTASYRTIRGFTIPALLADEIAFWRSDESAEPDQEILNAARPGMARLKGSMMFALSSPYAKKGALYKAVQDFYGKDIDGVLVWNADTLSMNPVFADQDEITKAFEEDPAKAGSEYGQGGKVVFRSDVEAFLDIEAVNRVTISGRYELAPQPGIKYVAFVDPSGGSQDSYPLAIAHRVGTGDSVRATLDLVREYPPPFSPETVTKAIADDCRRYGITTVTGDRYAGEWPREPYRKYGITYRVTDDTKSDIYRNLLPAVNAGRVALLDHKRLKAQLCGLERHVAHSGQDTIDHAPGGHDDIANAVAGALVLAAKKSGVTVLPFAF